MSNNPHQQPAASAFDVAVTRNARAPSVIGSIMTDEPSRTTFAAEFAKRARNRAETIVSSSRRFTIPPSVPDLGQSLINKHGSYQGTPPNTPQPEPGSSKTPKFNPSSVSSKNDDPINSIAKTAVPPTKKLNTHKYSADELKKMKNFESVETWEPITDLYLEHMSDFKKDNRALAWLIYCVVGLAVGCWAIVVFHSIDELSDIKIETIARILYEKTVAEAFVVHVAWSVAAATLSTLTCYFYPNGSGSGVPDVMAQLNGIDMPEQVKAMVILAKSVSVIFGVHSGMPVGAEGPMIHFGSIIGGLVSAGRSGSKHLNELLRPLYRTFQNPRDQRDFVTAGAAAGVTSVFAAPIGGFLFVMEELASFMSPKVAWMTFTSCLCSYVVVQVGGTYLESWKPTDVASGADAFSMNPDTVTLFAQNIKRIQYVPLTVLSILPTIAVAVGLGLWAAGFIHLHLNIVSRWRWPFINKTPFRKVAEPIILAALFNTIVFGLAVVMPCKPIQGDFHFDQLISGLPESADRLASATTTTTTTTTSAPSTTAALGFQSEGFSFVVPSAKRKEATRNTGLNFLGMPSSHAHPLFGRFFSDFSSSKTSTFSYLYGSKNSENNESSMLLENGTAPSAAATAYYGGLRLHTAFCKENARAPSLALPTHFSSFATLALTGPYNTIRMCFSRHTPHFLDADAIAIYFVLYSVGAAYCAGMFMASGIVIPTLIMGALGGRLIGYSVSSPWGDSGVLALYGAAAFFSGLSRLTVSLVVIMVEISDDLSNVSIMMVAVLIAKFTADALSHSLYHEQLQMRGMPFLDFDTQVHNLDKHCVADVMTADPECLPIVCSVSLLFKAARRKYAAFPVVRRGIRKEDLPSTNKFLRRSEFVSDSVNDEGDNNVTNIKVSTMNAISPEEDFSFLGTISRAMCGKLLWHLYICELNSPTAEPTLPTYFNLQEIDDFYIEHVQTVGIRSSVDGSEFWLPPETTTFRDRLVDLSPFINSSSFFVTSEMSISRAYNLFRSMSLRRLCVVDAANQLIGVLGRKNMLGHFLNENVQKKEKRLRDEMEK